jgi:hypothetical protein
MFFCFDVACVQNTTCERPITTTMAAKWRRRSEMADSSTPPGPSMGTRNKRGDHPSPAVGSPAAELFRGVNGKRVSFLFLVCRVSSNLLKVEFATRLTIEAPQHGTEEEAVA